MTDLRQAAERVLNDCTDAVSGWQSLAPQKLRYHMKAVEIEIDMWRTKEASARAERRMYGA